MSLAQVVKQAQKENGSLIKATFGVRGFQPQVHAVKALGDGHYRMSLVVFGNDDERDFDDDFFDYPDVTNYGVKFSDVMKPTTTVYFHHGMDEVLGLKELGNGHPGEMMVDDVAVWVDGWLDMRDEYEAAIYKLIEDRKMGSSSGTAGHLVRYERSGKGWRIKNWPLGLDASLTPIPNDWRQGLYMPVSPVKSLPKMNIKSFLVGLPEGMSKAQAKDKPVQPGTEAGKSTSEENLMGSELEQVQSDVAELKSGMSDIKTLIEGLGNPPKPEEQNIDPTKGVHVTKDELDKLIEAKMAERDKGKVPVRKGNQSTQEDVDGKGDTKADNAKTFFKAMTGDREAFASLKALETGTDSEGGYGVPEVLNDQIVVPMREDSILRRAGATVITITGTNSFKTNKLGFSSSSPAVAEEGPFTELDPSLAQIEHNPYKNGFITKLSDELNEDAAMDVFAMMIQPNARIAMSARENTWFTAGTGASQPQGISVGAALGKTAAATTVVTSDELIDLQDSVNYMYHPRCQWMMSQATRSIVRKLKDGDGNYLWEDGNWQAGIPPTLLGHPVVLNDSMPAMTTGLRPILFGDFSYYWIIDFGGAMVRYKYLDQLYAGNGQIGHRFYSRVDGKVMLDEAIKALEMA